MTTATTPHPMLALSDGGRRRARRRTHRGAGVDDHQPRHALPPQRRDGVEVEGIVRDGAVPATIAVLDGVPASASPATSWRCSPATATSPR